MIVSERDNQPVFIGYVGENNSRPVSFYVGDIIAKYPKLCYKLGEEIKLDIRTYSNLHFKKITEIQQTLRYVNFSICNNPPYNKTSGLSSLR